MLSQEYTPPPRPSSVATARRIYGQSSPPRSASPSSSRRRRKNNSGSQSARSSSRSHLNRWVQYTRAVSPDRSFVMPREDPMLSTAWPHQLAYDVGIDHREYAMVGTCATRPGVRTMPTSPRHPSHPSRALPSRSRKHPGGVGSRNGNKLRSNNHQPRRPHTSQGFDPHTSPQSPHFEADFSFRSALSPTAPPRKPVLRLSPRALAEGARRMAKPKTIVAPPRRKSTWRGLRSPKTDAGRFVAILAAHRRRVQALVNHEERPDLHTPKKPPREKATPGAECRSGLALVALVPELDHTEHSRRRSRFFGHFGESLRGMRDSEVFSAAVLIQGILRRQRAKREVGRRRLKQRDLVYSALSRAERVRVIVRRQELVSSIITGADTTELKRLSGHLHAALCACPVPNEDPTAPDDDGDSFCANVAAHARHLVKRLDVELELVGELTSEVRHGTVSGEPGSLAVDSRSVAVLQDTIKSCARLVDGTREFGKLASSTRGLMTREGKLARQHAVTVLRLRQSVLDATDGEGHGYDPSHTAAWQLVEECLVEARTAGCVPEEVAVVTRELEHRARVLAATRQLGLVIESLSEDELAAANDSAAALGLADHANAGVRESLVLAEDALGHVRRAKTLYEEGLRRVDSAILTEALEFADTFQFGRDANAVGKELGARATALRTQIEACAVKMAGALESLERPALEEAETMVADLGLKAADADTISSLLRLEEGEFLERQLAVAVKQDDLDRRVRILVTLNDLRFDGGMAGDVDLMRTRILRDRAVFSKKTKEQDSMMSWSKVPLKKTLTDALDGPSKDQKGDRKLALAMFKNIMGYMGDRKVGDVVEAGHAVVACGLQSATLRGELYLQIVKQITDNESTCSTSGDLGWNLLTLCLCTFPPPPSMEDGLDCWLRGQKEYECRARLQETKIQGARPAAPTMQQVAELMGTRTRVRL